ncbi:hypothetical protein [Clostridium sp. B9]|uniref:hypothetical protein n=1 Tax=Clostridium sp. B9 TaxID=3423224 RepID=UPI003D2EFD73
MILDYDKVLNDNSISGEVQKILNDYDFKDKDIKKRKEVLRKEINELSNLELWELEEFKLQDTYLGSFDVACEEVANAIIDYLIDEKAIMSLVAEGFIYPVTMKDANFISKRLKMEYENKETYDNIEIFTVPYRHFRKI